MKLCSICKNTIDGDTSGSVFVEAGEWLSEELWRDAGELCPRCLESRAKLAMMYLHEYNT